LETAEIARMNKDEVFQYEMSLMAQWDNYATLKTARETGHAEGKAEGRIDIARNMKQKGLDPALIAEMTGLSSDEIKRLQ
jgi:predicted transposase/invertase (TIGR01784 family)